MNFTVTWSQSAKTELASIWINSAKRGAVTEAAAEIDRLLALDPTSSGESRDQNLRILIVPPLVVVYATFLDDRLVSVLQVRTSQARSGGKDKG